VKAPVRQAIVHKEHTTGRKDLLNGKYNMNQEQTGFDSIPKQPTACCMPDTANETDMLEWAGISFGINDNYAM